MDAYEGYEPAMGWDASIGERFGHVRDISDTIVFLGATEAKLAPSIGCET